MLRQCIDCGLEAHAEEELELFRTHKASKYGRMNICKECSNAKRDYSTEKTDRQRKDNNLRQSYGIGIIDYERMYTEQGGRCKCCGVVGQLGKGKHMHVDHNHSTGEVRGLLCHMCNTGLGMFKDSTLKLKQAIIYLEENGSYGDD